MADKIHEIEDLVSTSYVGIASYTFLIYDHILTFSDEVEYIWRGRKGPIICLFFFNRYFLPLAFIVNLYAYVSRKFDHQICNHFVRYEGATTIIGFGVTGLMMILRVNALYGGKNRIVKAILGTFWLAQVGIYVWLLSIGMPVPHSPGIDGCSLIFDPRRTNLATLSALAPLMFDTAVIILTLYKTVGAEFRRSRYRPEIRESIFSKLKKVGSGNLLLKTLVMDGLLYYIVVFAANFAWTIMIITASPGTKNILGQLSQLITVTMMSRITLHLRKIGAKRNSTVIVSQSSLPAVQALPAGEGEYSDYTTYGPECGTESEVVFASPRSEISVG